MIYFENFSPSFAAPPFASHDSYAGTFFCGRFELINSEVLCVAPFKFQSRLQYHAFISVNRGTKVHIIVACMISHKEKPIHREYFLYFQTKTHSFSIKSLFLLFTVQRILLTVMLLFHVKQFLVPRLLCVSGFI